MEYISHQIYLKKQLLIDFYALSVYFVCPRLSKFKYTHMMDYNVWKYKKIQKNWYLHIIVMLHINLYIYNL